MVTRRGFMASTAALATAASLPMGSAHAQTQAPAAKWRRLNVNGKDPKLPRMLDSYRKAVTKMLSLPPSDPRNWYRNALVHTIDCPHGNWWFLIWHRGYVGWFEQICRELSGDAEFALPYWDWTQSPRIPAVMFDGVFNPDNAAFIASFDEFKKRFAPTVQTMWNGFTDAQFGQLLVRGLRFPEDLWFDIGGYPQRKVDPIFFPRGKTRDIKADNPALPDWAAKTVALPRLLDALAPRDFMTFGSLKARFHSTILGSGVLEGFPHNQVHNGIGGFMGDNLSPVDPVFFLHHANIERLWDLWTRKQNSLRPPSAPQSYPTTPTGDDLPLWKNEPFLFFVDAKGHPVPAAKAVAGAYVDIGDFNYSYEPGSGEEVVMTAKAAPAAAAPQIFAGKGAVTVPPPLLASAGDGAKLFAKVTIDLPPEAHHKQFRILVNAPDNVSSVDESSPFNAGAFQMFGKHVMHCPFTITVPVSRPVAALRSSGGLREGEPLRVRVVTEPKPMAGHAMLQQAPAAPVEVTSVVIEAH